MSFKFKHFSSVVLNRGFNFGFFGILEASANKVLSEAQIVDIVNSYRCHGRMGGLMLSNNHSDQTAVSCTTNAIYIADVHFPCDGILCTLQIKNAVDIVHSLRGKFIWIWTGLRLWNMLSVVTITVNICVFDDT